VYPLNLNPRPAVLDPEHYPEDRLQKALELLGRWAFTNGNVPWEETKAFLNGPGERLTNEPTWTFTEHRGESKGVVVLSAEQADRIKQLISEPMSIKTILGLDGKLLARVYDYDYFEKMMRASSSERTCSGCVHWERLESKKLGTCKELLKKMMGTYVVSPILHAPPRNQEVVWWTLEDFGCNLFAVKP
jgi:hypothetical protein